MDFTFPPDTLMLQDMLRRFVEKEVRPLESKYFLSGKLEPEERTRLQARIEQMGLWGATVPASLEGGELDLLTSCVLEEELGKTFIPLEIGDIPPVLYACQGPQIKKYLKPLLDGSRRLILAAREPGADQLEHWQASAEKTPAGYVLKGVKLLSALPNPEDFFAVFARTEAGWTAFLLDADQPGLEVHANHQVSLNLKDCLASPEAVLGQPGEALSLGREDAPRTWIRIGARYCGLVERLLDMSAAYASEWVALGRPLADRPAVRRMLAELHVQIEACRWLVYHAAWLADQEKPLSLPSAQVRLAAVSLLQKAADFATLAFGGPGPSPQTEPYRFIHNVLSKEVMNMTLESASAVVASHVLASYQRS